MFLKTTLTFLICLFLTGNIQSQVYWLKDFNLARSIANKSDRLIVMEFWASWCGPCKVMDSELWQNTELQKYSGNFVGLRINVDFEKSLTAYYKVTVIPKVMIISAGGDIIWETDGYDNAENFLSVFESMPGNVNELYKKSRILDENKKDFQANYSVAIEYQRLGTKIINNGLKNSFFKCSDVYLTKAQKLCDDPVLLEEIELNSVLNEVYCGRTQKALKMIENMNPNPQNENMAELRHYILAKCYRSANDQDNYQKEKLLIKRKEFLDQLED